MRAIDQTSPPLQDGAPRRWIAIGTFLLFAAVVGVQLIVREFRQVFESFGAELPPLTRLFVQGRHLLWLLPLLIPALTLSIRSGAPSRPRAGVIALVLGIGLGIVLLLACMILMYLPIIALAERAQ